MHVHRGLVAVLLAALAGLVPGSTRAQATGPGPRAGPGRWALLAGFEDGEGDAGLQLRADLELPQRPLSPIVAFSVVGSLGYSRFHEEQTDLFFQEQVKASLNLVKLIPSGRLVFGRNPVVRPYVDGGLGLYFASWRGEFRDLGTGLTLVDEGSELGLVLRIAAGIAFRVSDALSLGAEVGLLPYLGDRANDTLTSALLSASFRL